MMSGSCSATMTHRQARTPDARRPAATSDARPGPARPARRRAAPVRERGLRARPRRRDHRAGGPRDRLLLQPLRLQGRPAGGAAAGDLDRAAAPHGATARRHRRSRRGDQQSPTATWSVSPARSPSGRGCSCAWRLLRGTYARARRDSAMRDLEQRHRTPAASMSPSPELALQASGGALISVDAPMLTRRADPATPTRSTPRACCACFGVAGRRGGRDRPQTAA